jgi:hypothetical protein
VTFIAVRLLRLPPAPIRDDEIRAYEAASIFVDFQHGLRTPAFVPHWHFRPELLVEAEADAIDLGGLVTGR